MKYLVDFQHINALKRDIDSQSRAHRKRKYSNQTASLEMWLIFTNI